MIAVRCVSQADVHDFCMGWSRSVAFIALAIDGGKASNADIRDK